MAKKKKKSALKSIATTTIYLSAIILAIYFITLYLNKPKFVRYSAFGIAIPINYTIQGIDVSHHQAAIDWEAVKEMKDKNLKIGFAFIKATEGINDIDNNFRSNWFNAKDVGIPRGAYHFFIASKSGRAQAQNFIQNVLLQKGDIPPVLDIEQTNGVAKEDIQQRVQDFLTTIEKEYNVKPIIYTNADFYENFLSGQFETYPLWVAHYLTKDKPKIKHNWIFWQHNENGNVDGIATPTDFNVFNGDSTDFKKLLIK